MSALAIVARNNLNTKITLKNFFFFFFFSDRAFLLPFLMLTLEWMLTSLSIHYSEACGPLSDNKIEWSKL